MKSSSSPRPVVLVASHLGALALGLVLFKSFAPARGGAAEVTAEAGAAHPVVRPEAAPPASSATTRTVRALKPSVHRSAWLALADQGLERPERMKASAVILRGWIAEDWQTALDTVMGETPDDFDLLDEFRPLFLQQPEAVWDVIGEKRYGVLTAVLRTRWIHSTAGLDESEISRLASSLPPEGKAAADEALRQKLNRARMKRVFDGER